MISSLKHLAVRILSLFFLDKKMNRKTLGEIGEVLACKHLKRHGYAILERNYSTPIGEIDIVAEDGKILVFVEVKTRRSIAYGLPEEAINSKKIRKLIRLAQFYIRNKRLYSKQMRFDIVSILMQSKFSKKSLKLIKNAFYAEE